MRELAPYPDLFPCKNACHVAKVRHSFDGTHKSSAKIGMLGAAMRALCVFRNKAHFAPAGKADGSYVQYTKAMYEELGTAMYQLSVIPLLVRVIWGALYVFNRNLHLIEDRVIVFENFYVNIMTE